MYKFTSMQEKAMDALIDHLKNYGYKKEECREAFCAISHNCNTDEECQELIDWLKEHPKADKEKILLHVYCRRDGIKEN